MQRKYVAWHYADCQHPNFAMTLHEKKTRSANLQHVDIHQLRWGGRWNRLRLTHRPAANVRIRRAQWKATTQWRILPYRCVFVPTYAKTQRSAWILRYTAVAILQQYLGGSWQPWSCQSDDRKIHNEKKVSLIERTWAKRIPLMVSSHDQVE